MAHEGWHLVRNGEDEPAHYFIGHNFTACGYFHEPAILGRRSMRCERCEMKAAELAEAAADYDDDRKYDVADANDRLERAERDTVRLDWMEEMYAESLWLDCFDGERRWTIDGGDSWHDTLRDALDAAMADYQRR